MAMAKVHDRLIERFKEEPEYIALKNAWYEFLKTCKEYDDKICEDKKEISADVYHLMRQFSVKKHKELIKVYSSAVRVKYSVARIDAERQLRKELRTWK